jgi:hypothetical protein
LTSSKNGKPYLTKLAEVQAVIRDTLKQRLRAAYASDEKPLGGGRNASTREVLARHSRPWTVWDVLYIFVLLVWLYRV